MISETDDGKLGFVLTVAALLAVVGSFGTMAFRGSSDVLLTVIFCSLVIAAMGHFLLGGAEFREQMLEDKRNNRQG